MRLLNVDTLSFNEYVVTDPLALYDRVASLDCGCRGDIGGCARGEEDENSWVSQDARVCSIYKDIPATSEVAIGRQGLHKSV
jgi:hypothetical protein